MAFRQSALHQYTNGFIGKESMPRFFTETVVKSFVSNTRQTAQLTRIPSYKYGHPSGGGYKN